MTMHEYFVALAAIGIGAITRVCSRLSRNTSGELTMTITKALQIAKGRVSIVPQGSDYVLHTWSPKHNATWVSHSMDRYRAQTAAYENKIQIALELLGVDNIEAGAIANVAAYNRDGDWRSVVRREYRAIQGEHP